MCHGSDNNVNDCRLLHFDGWYMILILILVLILIRMRVQLHVHVCKYGTSPIFFCVGK